MCASHKVLPFFFFVILFLSGPPTLGAQPFSGDPYQEILDRLEQIEHRVQKIEAEDQKIFERDQKILEEIRQLGITIVHAPGRKKKS